ncbi:MAG: DUF305 domain-containing protein [Solirubrobacterales bacterium]
MRSKILPVLVAVLIVAAVVTAGCGSDSEDQSSLGNATDVGFVNDMIAHHQSAIEMAALARKSADHPETRVLADDIATAQKGEITVMRRIGDELRAHGATGDSMGTAAGQMGMESDPSHLAGAKPFDRAFIDAMIPHHLGAIEMARLELQDGEHPELKRIAREIISAQEAEVAKMQTWRKKWFGSALPIADPSAKMGSRGDEMPDGPSESPMQHDN